MRVFTFNFNICKTQNKTNSKKTKNEKTKIY